MQKTLLTLLGSTLLVIATLQIADAAQKSRKAQGAPAATAEQFHNSNAAWPQQSVQPDWSRYSRGYSAPAGH